MIGCTWLARLVIRVVADGVPAGTGRRSASTGSRIIQSALTWNRPRTQGMVSGIASVAL
jgi:hypothetical protein